MLHTHALLHRITCREKTYKNPDWVAAMVQQCGGFPEVRTLEQTDVGPVIGHTQRLDWDDIAWSVLFVELALSPLLVMDTPRMLGAL